MDEKRNIYNVIDMGGMPLEDTPKQVVLLFVFIGIGIGIGYAIGKKSEQSGPILDATDSPSTTYDSWLDAPCNDEEQPQCPTGYEKRPLLLLSLDGFRADYLLRGLTPNIEKLGRYSVLATQSPENRDGGEENRPSLITLYFDEPDHEGHDTGPYSDELNVVLQRVDKTVGDLMDGIVKAGLHNCMDVIVLADHGMAERSCDRVFFMGDYITTSEYYYRLGANARLEPKSNAKLKDPHDIVGAMQCEENHVTPYVKWELPKNWHYSNNLRIDNTVIVADNGWTISSNNDSNYQERYCSGGTHGYDNKGESMGALFLAHGPSFKQHQQIDTFLNIELYNLMTDILDIEPAPNNGTPGSLNHILRNPKVIDEPDKDDALTPIEYSFPQGTDYDDRINEDTSHCTCALQDVSKSIKDFDKQLDLTSTEIAKSLASNAPLGRPLVDHDTSHSVMIQRNYIVGYNNEFRMPMWVTYSVKKEEKRGNAEPIEDCTRPDVRIPDDKSADCDDYTMATADNITMSYLYQPDIWLAMEEKIKAWADKYNGVNVIAGPVFDYNYDSLQDNLEIIDENGIKYGAVVMPTHYFVVVLRCNGTTPIDSCADDYDSISFIISHTDGIKTCQKTDRYLQTQLANIKDVEVITKLRLVPNLPIIKSLHLKTRLTSDLWDD
uniref:Ectonucleotide pyrophosphatase/phosphodiesterase family member 3-like n=1 Tax=Saccoglossus kowalevskii TaxID=10224 RepID=A0ABM0MUC0_SACKO|nr:PREDICTED: ectonucleotide pyrophosphatase/phosphodiesterase family member 3-like [Saccoglossus kowalevskii]